MKKIEDFVITTIFAFIFAFIPIQIYNWYTKYNNREKIITVLTKQINANYKLIEEISNIECKCLSEKEIDKLHKMSHQYKTDITELNIELAKISSDIIL